MNGKIFPGSANIWQDQAKVLFNYYQQAAERIVSEEERIESQIAGLEEEKVMVEEKLSKVWVWLFALIIPYFIKKKSLKKKIEDLEERIAEFQKMHSEIFRDYKVSKFGVAYVPVAEKVKYEDKSFIVDLTGSVPESHISMSVSRQNDLLISTVQELDRLTKEAPIVETSEEAETISTDDYSLSIQEVKENDYVGALERSLRTLAFCMDDLDTTSVTLPVVTDNSDYLSQLEQFATTSTPANAEVVNVFDSEVFKPAIKKFEEINDLKNTLSNETSQFEEVLRQLMQAIGYSVQTVARLKVASVDKVVLESNRLLYQILKAPYNHYSPTLEAEEIERIRNERFDYSDSVQGYDPFVLKHSSRVRFNPLTGTWVAEDGSQTVQPFGIHQMYEEIMVPVVENLMQENRIERLKIYNNIKDQKLSYLNKWHQDTDAFYRSNRAESADLINLMQQTLTEYISAYNNLLSLKNTENNMAASGGQLDATIVEAVENDDETVAAFELQSQEFQKCQTDFEDYIDRLKEDIDLKAEMFGHVEYYDARLRDGYSNEAAVAAASVHELDDRRKVLASINPKLAKDSELLPEPHVSDLTYEHFAINLPGIVFETMASLNTEPEILTEGPSEEAPEAPAQEESEEAMPPVPGAPEMPEVPAEEETVEEETEVSEEMPPVPETEEEEETQSETPQMPPLPDAEGPAMPPAFNPEDEEDEEPEN